MQKHLLTILVLLTFVGCTKENKVDFNSVDYTKFLNPFIGTDGT